MRCAPRADRLPSGVAMFPYFRDNGSMTRGDPSLLARTAERFAALGAEPRLQIVRTLLAAHPSGMVAGDLQEELGIPASTLSHHLERLKRVGLVGVRREGTFLWYAAKTDVLGELLQFLYAECCTRSRAVALESVLENSE